MTESLLLKWGTLKGWNLESERSLNLMRKYCELGSSFSAMAQRDTDEQRRLICELIDAVDGEIVNDWSGEVMTKDQAKEYIMDYRR